MANLEEIKVGNIFKLRTLTLTNYLLFQYKNCEGKGLTHIQTYEEFIILEIIEEIIPAVYFDKSYLAIHFYVMILGKNCPAIGWLTFPKFSNAFDDWEKIL